MGRYIYDDNFQRGKGISQHENLYLKRGSTGGIADEKTLG